MGTDAEGEEGEGSDGLRLPSLGMKEFALLTATLLISVSFYGLAQPFLISLVLAGIFAVLVQPFYQRVSTLVGDRAALASSLTLLVGLIMVIIPLLLIGYLAATQASTVVADYEILVKSVSEDVSALKAGTLELPDWVPFQKGLEASGPQIYAKATELLNTVAGFVLSSLTHVTNGTAELFVSLFTFLYGMFLFLPMKRSVFEQVLEYSNLPKSLQKDMADKIAVISRATIKGSLLIGVTQGALGGLGFWAAGFDGTVFWAVIMMVLAAIPGIGATPIVLCGAVYLGVNGNITAAIALGLWGAVVVGAIDNILRPRLVGRDAQMSDIWIFVGTLGGLATMGVSGLVLGPVMAGLFISVWQEVSGFNGQSEDPSEIETSDPDSNKKTSA